MRRALLAAVVLLAVLTLPAHAVSPPTCKDGTGPRPLAVAGATGAVAYPEQLPKGLVVFFHGYGHTAQDWADNHLERVARESDVITLALDYPGTDAEHTWQVQEGATASVAAAQAIVADCPTIRTTIAYGVSMGGNASGLAVADTTGVFDWWFDIEGANNVIETYLEATALAPANAFAAEAARGIELEMGGTIAEVPEAYQQHSNVLRVDDIVASGIKGVVMVHGVGDGLVPYNQSVEMARALEARGMPVDFTTITTRPDGTPDDTTIDGYIPVEHTSPFAGHANEDDEEHVVNATGFAKLRELLATS